jgi:tetratricopeptide (TPR) repeat protein
MGKTALALAAARWQHERNRWSDGVWLVTLRNVASAHDARSQIGLALNLDPKAAESDAALAAALRDRHILIVLDDLDALLTHDHSGTAALLTALLGARRLKLITTARRDLPGRVHHHRIDLKRLEGRDAQIAFIAFAPPISDWGAWTTDDWFNLHRFLDGYPFPIRLAATAMKQARLGLRDLLRRLQENPQGTFRYPGDEEDRETSLAATLDLSYNLLPANAQQVFGLLALFPAGLTRNAARDILEEASEAALETLVQHGMAEWRDDGGYRRFALPEPARRYAEVRQPLNALATYAPPALAFFADLIDAAADAIIGGKIVEGRMVITLEQPNIERFLEWGYDHEDGSGGISRAARATAQLRNYWTLTDDRGSDATLARVERALAAAQRVGDRLGEANVLQAIGDVQRFRGERDAALASYQQALAAAQRVGDRLGEANVLQAIGDVQRFRDERDAALASYQQALELFRAIGARLGEANVLQAIGDVQQFRGERDAALASYQQALELFRAIGARLGEANVLAALSRLRIDDDPAESQRLLEQALALRRAIDSVYAEGADLGNYGIALLQRGRGVEALPYLERARDLFASRGVMHLVKQTEQLIAQAKGEGG